MNILTLIFQVLMIIAFMMAGVVKLIQPLPELIAMGMLWVEDFSELQVRVIAALEVLGALGMMLPYVLKFLPRVLVSLAAGGLAVTMIGAIATHIGRADPALSIIINSMLLLMCAFVAVRRYKVAA